MSDIVIHVENLSKRYVLGRSENGSDSGLRHVLQRAIMAPIRVLAKSTRKDPPHRPGRLAKEEFWALQDVSFEVRRGEVVGIAGRNGAGKTTLLKILSRITEPTSGRIGLKGRIASLLEVGTGFHPELTGRENIFLNGAILGMAREEIREKFDEIVDFAEIRAFLDTPVKRYSSGMYVRLAFAVAAHLEPEILIVDEVLAVGDAQFQKKCLGKMQDVSRGEGRTVLFVSHNMAAVQALCDSAILLQEGRLAARGKVHEVISLYSAKSSNSSSGNGGYIDLTRTVRLTSVSVHPAPAHCLGPLEVEFLFFAREEVFVHMLVPLVHDISGRRVGIFDLPEKGYQNSVWCKGSHRLKLSISRLMLTEGEYDLGLYLWADRSHGEWLGLHQLLIAPPESLAVYTRIPSEHRGCVEMDFSVSIDESP